MLSIDTIPHGNTKKNELIEHAKAVSAFGPRVESITTRIEWDESWSRIASFSSRWIRYAISKSLTLSPIFDYKSFGCELLQIVRLLFCFFSLSILSFPRSLFPSFCSTSFFSFNSFFNVNHGLNQAATGHKYLYTNSFVTKTKWRTFNRTFWLYVCSLQYLLHYRTWYVMLTYPSMSCCSIFHLLIPKPPLKSRSVRNKFVRALCILLCFS